jgi:50S ribosomal protein L16 3-hydroxylase
MPAVPVEVRGNPRQPLGMAPARFLRDYWQKRPLLIRGGFPQFHNVLTPEDLAGLACEEAALSRLVLHDPDARNWTVRNGPFTARDFKRLSERHWTLLVQDVDKWDADVAGLLAQFAFLPAWRIDDIMISYATEGGGVGPHVDNYDVFLVQGLGRRRWRISTDAQASQALRADAQLKLLQDFIPTHDWVLRPGDALYLPPGIAHEGTALGDCMTFSVGMRAPSQSELLLDFAESVAESLSDAQRYGDPDLKVARDGNEIDAEALARVQSALPHLGSIDRASLAHWFGCFVTRYRAAHEAAPLTRAMSLARLATLLPGSRLLRNPWSRMAWTGQTIGVELFVAGHAYRCPRALARKLAAARDISGADILRSAGAQGMPVILDLVNAGHLQLVKQR